ncbi:MAG: hypothetical protein HYY01_00525 [Chloroflexi bacterium]|nr:hypothetical protein [Chloroflexota bacterium]
MWNVPQGPDYIPSEKELEQRRRDITQGRGSYRGGMLANFLITLVIMVVMFVVFMLLI